MRRKPHEQILSFPWYHRHLVRASIAAPCARLPSLPLQRALQPVLAGTLSGDRLAMLSTVEWTVTEGWSEIEEWSLPLAMRPASVKRPAYHLEIAHLPRRVCLAASVLMPRPVLQAPSSSRNE